LGFDETTVVSLGSQLFASKPSYFSTFTCVASSPWKALIVDSCNIFVGDTYKIKHVPLMGEDGPFDALGAFRNQHI
jgi:hypothetical protein